MMKTEFWCTCTVPPGMAFAGELCNLDEPHGAGDMHHYDHFKGYEGELPMDVYLGSSWDGRVYPRPHGSRHIHEWLYDEHECDEPPYVYVQWKGTNVCADVYCSCGTSTHIDDDFMYFYECIGCGKLYVVGTHVRMYEVPNEFIEDVRTNSIMCIKRGEDHEDD